MVGKRGIREKIDKGKRGGGGGADGREGKRGQDRRGLGGGRGLYVTCQITSRSPH